MVLVPEMVVSETSTTHDVFHASRLILFVRLTRQFLVGQLFGVFL